MIFIKAAQNILKDITRFQEKPFKIGIILNISIHILKVMEE